MQRWCRHTHKERECVSTCVFTLHTHTHLSSLSATHSRRNTKEPAFCDGTFCLWRVKKITDTAGIVWWKILVVLKLDFFLNLGILKTENRPMPVLKSLRNWVCKHLESDTVRCQQVKSTHHRSDYCCSLSMAITYSSQLNAVPWSARALCLLGSGWGFCQWTGSSTICFMENALKLSKATVTGHPQAQEHAVFPSSWKLWFSLLGQYISWTLPLFSQQTSVKYETSP